MSRKRDLTQQEWRKVGYDISVCIEFLFDLAKQVGTSLGAPGMDRVLTVARRAEALRTWLADHAFDQHPNWGGKWDAFYNAMPPGGDCHSNGML